MLSVKFAKDPLSDCIFGLIQSKMSYNVIFLEYDDIKPSGKSGISKLGTNTLQGLLIITDINNIMKLTHRVYFWGVCSKKE